MCTLVILRRPEHDWPVIIGANRDEMIDRPAKPPGRHWADRAEVVAGLDLLAGGSWLGVNDWGVAAAVPDPAGPPRTPPRRAPAGRVGAGGARPCRRGRGRRGAGATQHRRLPELQPDPRRQPRRLLAAR